MLDGISSFFVREKTALDGEDPTSSVLDYGSGSSQYWKLLTSALLNKFNPRNKIFEQELSKKEDMEETSGVQCDDGVYRGQLIPGTNTREGVGMIAFEDMSIYEGEWSNDKPHGKGRHYMSNGDLYEGEYEEGL